MFEYFFQRTMDAIIVGLANLISSVTVENTEENYEEEIKENKLITKIEDSKNVSLLKSISIRSVISELPEPRWIKIGKVTNLHMYPLISGKACDADECQVTFDETYMFRKGQLITWDRSFVVYDKDTKCILTIKKFPELLKVELSVKDNYITLRTSKMPTLSVELKNKEFVKCSYSSSETYQVFPIFTCVDCGDEVAKWLSKFLVDKEYSLRLGYAMSFVNPLKMYWQSWNGHKSLFVGNIWNGHSLGPFINISPGKTFAGNQILQELKKSEMLEIEDSYGMIYPTITISTLNQYLERKWEWMKVGDLIIKISKSAIIKGSNRTFNDNGKLFGLGVNCILYKAGYIKLNDHVYAHFP